MTMKYFDYHAQVGDSIEHQEFEKYNRMGNEYVINVQFDSVLTDCALYLVW